MIRANSQLTRSTMNSTARFHSKSRTDNVYSPFESRIAEINSPMAHSSSLRRSAKRWAAKPKDHPGVHERLSSTPQSGVLAASPGTPTEADASQPNAPITPHPIESLITSLYYPPDVDVRAKASEYEWYIHYPSDPASHALEMADEKDLELYVRQSRLSGADDGDVERLLIPDLANWVSAADEVARREKERLREVEREKERNLGVAQGHKEMDGSGTAPASGHGSRERSGDTREVGLYEAWLRGV